MIKKLLTKIKYYSLICLPFVSVLLSIFLYNLPYPITNSSILMPSIILAVIYYWSVYYPQFLPYICLLVLGLLQDIIEVNILGFNAIIFIVFRVLIRSQRKYLINKSFIVVWAGFIFCLGAILVLPMLVNVYDYPISILFSKWLISIFAYVPIHWILSKMRLRQ